MKKSIALFSLAVLLVCGNNVFAQEKANSKDCEVTSLAKPIAKSRGKNPLIAKIPAQHKMLNKKAAQSRGKKPECMISFYNYNSQKVHVFVDSMYVGSVQPNSVGVVESIKKYNKVLCISDDKASSWVENGECKCVFVYHLKVNENEGEVKY